jgi:hypothetical protein
MFYWDTIPSELRCPVGQHTSIQMYETTTLPVLNWCETWPAILEAERRLGGPENKMLMELFGPMRGLNELRKDWLQQSTLLVFLLGLCTV